MPRQKQLQFFHKIQSLPVEYEHRVCTDVFCIIVGLIYSLVLLILAITLWRYQKFVKTNFPSDSAGTLCGIDKAQFPVVYFAKLPDISKRVCVQSCPVQGDKSLKCVPTDNIGCRFSSEPGYQVNYYASKLQNTRSGYFCMPTDQSMRKKIMVESDLENRQLLYNSLDTIMLCFFVALGCSLLFFILVQFLPKIMNYVVIALGMITILASGVCLFYYETTFTTFKIVLGCLLVLSFIIIVFLIIQNMDSIRMYGIFLQASTQFVKDRPFALLYIPLFLLLIAGFIAMVVLQFTSFWTAGDISFSPNDLFYRLQGAGPIVLIVFLAIQVIWGLSFLKLAFTFCVSGQAVLWYHNRKQALCQPLKLLLCKHLGSVIGGSFLLGFFTIFDFIFDLFKPNMNTNQNSCHTRCYRSACQNSLFDLIRTDSMAFINLTGNPFCNSARYCQYLCNRSVLLNDSKSTSRIYRLCAHILLVGIMLLIAMYIKGVISIYAIGLIIISTLYISTLFISFHADVAEAIQITMLAEQQLNKQLNIQNQRIKEQYLINPVSRSRSQQVVHAMSSLKLHKQLVQQVKNQRLNQVKDHTQQIRNDYVEQRKSRI